MGMARSKDELIIEHLERDNKELRDEKQKLRQQLAESQARADRAEKTIRGYAGPFLLRKQAEAADECLRLLKQPEGLFQMQNYAAGLRQQAAELEK
jgi:hypothetical protein